MGRPGVAATTQSFPAMGQRGDFINRLLVNEAADDLRVAQDFHVVTSGRSLYHNIHPRRIFCTKSPKNLNESAVKISHIPDMSTTTTPYQLTQKQQDFYEEKGYLLGLPPIYSKQEMAQLNAELPQLLALLQPGETAKDIREWHESSTYLYDIVMNPKIHDLVEGVLGPNFYCWASSFFIKEPLSTSTVGWHQDAYYWPMHPHKSVTVWLAFDDVDEINGGMKLIPGSHRHGLIKHKRSQNTDSVLTLELETGTFLLDDAIQFKLKAGEASLHDDRAVHGSPANPSTRRRAGLTIRYSSTEVKNDLAVNPNFKAYLCRGVDVFHHNPVGVPPTERFGRPSFKAVSIEEAGATK